MKKENYCRFLFMLERGKRSRIAYCNSIGGCPDCIHAKDNGRGCSFEGGFVTISCAEVRACTSEKAIDEMELQRKSAGAGIFKIQIIESGSGKISYRSFDSEQEFVAWKKERHSPHDTIAVI